MEHKIKSIRTFIGCKDFTVSRAFYKALGFKEVLLGDKMSYFRIENFGFYLQDYYTKDWIENLMLFLEVEDVYSHLEELKKLQLQEKFSTIRISEIVKKDWGDEYFLHDPSGVLWHIGAFK